MEMKAGVFPVEEVTHIQRSGGSKQTAWCCLKELKRKDQGGEHSKHRRGRLGMQNEYLYRGGFIGRDWFFVKHKGKQLMNLK